MTWLASLPAGVLVVGWLVFALAVAAISRVAIRAIVPVAEHDHVASICSPLMPALGATFAVLMALTLSSEAGYLRSAQDIVSTEAAAAARLAWASTSPGVDTVPIQASLTAYLRSTRAREWHGTNATEGDDPTTAVLLARLERVVRAEAARPALGTATSSELLASLDALTSERRARIAAASRTLPPLIIVTLIASGVALIINGGALVFRSSLRTSVLVIGLAVVVALSLALLFAITGPWEGPLIVSGRPLDTVVRDLGSSFFTR
jgi:hypothetical protein